MQQQVITIALADALVTHRVAYEELLNAAKNYAFKVVMLAVNGTDLINRLEQAQALPEIVLLDINMPVMNGYRALRIIRSRWPQLKVLVLSGHRNDYTIARVICDGANGFISKQATPDELFVALQQIATTGFYHTDKVKSLLSKGTEELNRVYPHITEMEMEYLVHLYTHHTNNAIAGAMNITVPQARNIQQDLCRKLAYRQPAQLCLFAIHIGLIVNMELMGVA
ncbi:MAG: response regulator transcription factor [Taibaiella sp.]|nr:response regulator transcription factor [Taibaiella sp.]